MRFIYLLLLMGFCFAQETFIANEAVINLHSQPNDASDVVSQTIYGLPISVLKREGDWALIQSEDQYEGWVEMKSFKENSSYFQNPCLRSVNSLFAHIYLDPDTAIRKPLYTLSFGSLIKVPEIPEQIGRWLEIELVDGTKGWIQSADLNLHPHLLTLDEMIDLSKKFVGLTYTWGGRSAFGYDCSGFVQMLVNQMGIDFPRDSSPQAESSILVDVKKEEMQVGDLVFFGETRITHVGFYLGNNQFISSSVRDDAPGVTISDFATTKYNLVKVGRIKN